jgi:hypothetical protein
MILAIPGLIGSPAEAVERCVLVELMTWVRCTGCPDAEAALDSLSAEYPDSALAIIRDHPSAGANPFRAAPEYFRHRWDYYDRPDFPTAYFDGGLTLLGADDSVYYEYKPRIEARLAIPSPLQISASVFYDSLSRTGTAVVQVTVLDPHDPEDLHLRCVLTESWLEYDGEDFEDVYRAIFPDSAGLDVTIAVGEKAQYLVPFVMDSLWIPENCGLVVFVQNDATKEVLQSAQCLYPSWTPPMAIPRTVDDLKSTLCGSNLHLSWSPVTEDVLGNPLTVDYYRIYGAAARFPTTPTKSLIDSTADLFFVDGHCGQVGNLRLHCSFNVTAMAGGLESSFSNEVGEYDKLMKRVK